MLVRVARSCGKPITGHSIQKIFQYSKQKLRQEIISLSPRMFLSDLVAREPDEDHNAAAKPASDIL
jgi:hypothetical protein